MTLDEAIKHAEKVIVENLEKTKDRKASDPIAINCFECAKEHKQLVEWLKDYKRLKEQEFCEDTISRHAVNTLIDELARAISDERCCISRGRSTATIMRDILHLPPVTPHQKIGRWIPVSERLPEENGYYLTTTMYHEVYCDYWVEDRFNRTEVVIAWMPLPAPFEPQERSGEE